MEPAFKDFEFQCVFNRLSDLKIDKKYDEVEKLAKKTLTQALDRKNKYAQAVAYYYLAEVSLIKMNSDKCIELCWNIITIYKDREYDYLYALCCNLLGKAYGNKLDSFNALTFFLKGYYLCLEQKFHNTRFRILNNIGTLFFFLGYNEDAIKFYKSALKEIKEHEEISSEIYEIILVNIMSLYIRMQDFDNAKKWEELYNKEFPDSQNTVGYEGYIVYMILDSSHKNDYEKMAYYVHDLIEFTKRIWYGTYSVRLLFEMAKCCLKEKQYHLVNDCLACVEEFIPKEDFRTKFQLSRLFIQLYQETNDDKLLEEYERYFELSKVNSQEDKKIEYQGLQNKLALEAELHAKQLLIRENAELSEKTEKDLFTGVLNKASFVERVNNELANLKGQEYGVLLVIDVDDFKSVNDQYGHLAGDEVLKKISQLLLTITRQTDHVGRIGGDEFCIFMNNVQNSSLLESKVERLMMTISNIPLVLAPDYKISVSIGIAESSSCCNFDTLFTKADEALYEAKAKGKNTFVFHND